MRTMSRIDAKAEGGGHACVCHSDCRSARLRIAFSRGFRIARPLADFGASLDGGGDEQRGRRSGKAGAEHGRGRPAVQYPWEVPDNYEGQAIKYLDQAVSISMP
jgi:hypothetical protein